MPDDDVPTEALMVIELIAGAIRDELGDEVDAYPGHSAPEQADPINRAFQAVVRSLLEAGGTPAASLPALVSRTLRRAATGASGPAPRCCSGSSPASRSSRRRPCSGSTRWR